MFRVYRDIFTSQFNSTISPFFENLIELIHFMGNGERADMRGKGGGGKRGGGGGGGEEVKFGRDG